jgi:N-acetylmuramoyl-L-alanine amidase
LIPYRKYAAVLLAALAGASAAVYSSRAQPQGQTSTAAQPQPAAASTTNRNLVVLDAAHGGPDPGATIGDHVFEKDVAIAIAARLRTALTAAGFTVIATREANAADTLTTDQRAEIANRTHAVACIVLHATTTGVGVHIYTSPLQPFAPEEGAGADSAPAFVPVPWETAQSGFVSQSLRMASDVRAALAKGNLPAVVGRAPVRPLDNLMCPAVVIEVAPLVAAGGGATPVTDADYQQRVVGILTAALRTWRNHSDVPAPHASATPKDGINSSSDLQQHAVTKAKAAANPTGVATAKDHAHSGIQAGGKTLPTNPGKSALPNPSAATGADPGRKASQ